MNARILKERPQDAVDEPGVDVDNVGVDPEQDIPAGDQQALPQCLPLAFPRQNLGQKLLVNINGDAFRPGDLTRPVAGVRIDQNDFIQQGNVLHQRLFQPADHAADSSFFVQRGKREADGQSQTLFQSSQLAKIRELIRMVGVLGKPFVDQDRNRLRSGGFLGKPHRSRAPVFHRQNGRGGFLQDSVRHRTQGNRLSHRLSCHPHYDQVAVAAFLDD